MSWRLVGVSNFAATSSTLSITAASILTLGRAHVADSSKNVSRTHLELSVNGEGALMATALSINSPVIRRGDATMQLVKGEPTPLAHGDYISLLTIGDYVWKVENSAPPPSSASATTAKRSRSAPAPAPAPVSTSATREEDEPPLKRARIDVQDPSSALKQVARVVMPLLGSGGALSASSLGSVAEKELAAYAALPTLLIVDDASSLRISNSRVRVVKDPDFGAASCALILEVSWRWKATSLFSKQYLGPTAHQHCKATFGQTAKCGQAYVVPASVGAGLPPNVAAIILVVSPSKADNLDLSQARDLLHELYQTLSRFLTTS